MKNSLACRDCIHNEVCMHRSILSSLQSELSDALEHACFTVGGQYNRTRKLKDFDFIKTVKIECEYYERDMSILED